MSVRSPSSSERTSSCRSTCEIITNWMRCFGASTKSGLDTLLHSIAFCPRADLHGRVVDCSAEGFALAMDISVHSFLRLIRRAEPLMPLGGTCLTVTFYGSEKVVEHYNIMGPVKAALESVTRYVAAELGPKGISVHALSPGRCRPGRPQALPNSTSY
jgi:enoyl-[acyl-carrier-protein] reductase (NADH)